MPINHDSRERCVGCLKGFAVFWDKGKPYATSIPARQIQGRWVCLKCFKERKLDDKANVRYLFNVIRDLEAYS